MPIKAADARAHYKNRCTACEYPRFGLDTINKEDMCEKHLIKLTKLEKGWAREDALWSLLKSGSDYSKP